MSDSEEHFHSLDGNDVFASLPINESGVIDREIVHSIIGVGAAPITPTNEQQGDELAVATIAQDQDTTEPEPETKEETPTSEIENESTTNSDQSNAKTCRELKSILALSKEAKLDTNISHKRKTLDNVKGSNSNISLIKDSPLRNNSIENDSPKRIIKPSTSDVKAVRYPVTAECEIECNLTQSEDKEDKNPSKVKRKRDSSSESSPGGSTDDINKKIRKSFSHDIVMFKENKDMFCWRCHRDAVDIACETCPRSYHQKCLKQTINDADHWPCPECVSILMAESTKSRSNAMKGMTLEHLCSLLKFAVNRMIQCNGSEPFIHPVNEKDFPDYTKYIIQPMYLTLLEKNIKENLYGSTQAFEADAKWILHNSIIFNSYQSKLTSAAKGIVKICKQEMAEIENCPSCYLNANTKKNTWFVEVCPKPHLLVWAKLKGFPYWPAKSMCANPSGMVDVRFFGAHDRAWVHYKDCYLYSIKDPNSYKQKRYDIEKCKMELSTYVENLRHVYGEVNLAPFKTPFSPDPKHEMKQIKMLLPSFTDPKSKMTSIHSEDSNDKDELVNEEQDVTSKVDNRLDASMEGYGTDDDSKSEINNDVRRKLLIKHKTESGEDFDKNEDDDEEMDTQASVDTKLNVIRGGSVRMRGGFNNFTGKLKIIPRQVTDVSLKKLHGLNDSVDINLIKRSRRNSDLSTKSDSSRISNVSDKISKVDVTENVEISLRNDNISSTTSESSKSDFDQNSAKLVQLEVENREFSISPSKLKITDTLIKRLSDADDTSKNLDKKDNESEEPCSSTVDVEKEQSPDESSLNKENKNEEKEINKPEIEITKVSSKTVETVTEKKDFPTSERSSVVIEIADKKIEISSTSGNNVSNCDDHSKITLKSSEFDKNKNVSIIEDFGECSEDILDSSQINQADIRNIIHSSLNEDSSEASKKRKIEYDDVTEDEQPLAKLVKIVNVTKLMNEKESDKNNINSSSSSTNGDTIENAIQSKESLLKKKCRKAPNPQSLTEQIKITNETLPEDLVAVEIKSEHDSDDDFSETEYMEAKRKYLSALNISEKQKESTKIKLHEIRTRSKTEGRKERLKSVDNLAKTIDDVASNTSVNAEGKKKKTLRITSITTPTITSTRDDGGEISVKSFAKFQLQKQRARKTFPTPKYDKPSTPPINGSVTLKEIQTKTTLPNKTPSIVTLTPVSSSAPITSKTTTISSLDPLRSAGSLVILAPQQQQVLLPPAYNTSIASSIFTMVPPLISTTSSQLVQTTPPNLNHSQNYIPQNEVNRDISNTSTNVLLESLVQNPPQSQGTSEPQTSTNNENNATVSEQEDLSVLQSMMPRTVSKAVSDLLCRPPPKLKPRPPGALSKVFDEGVPSTAGSVTSKVNSIAHRLSDYFRGMLIETLADLGKSNSAEATISNLKLEIEALKHKHEVEMSEIQKNVTTILKDIQSSIAEERSRLVDQTRAACEVETVRRVEEAKSKQWCANCSKEAQFYCCWNTSYCDYPCQQKHWSQHMSKCTQSLNVSSSSSSPSPGTIRNPNQPLVLRPANPPKQGIGRMLGKPAKVYMNRAIGSTTKNVFKGPTGQHITLVEATPGGFELLGNGSISVGGKILSSNSVLNKLKISSPTSSKPKITAVQVKPTMPTITSKPITTATETAVTTISDDDVE